MQAITTTYQGPRGRKQSSDLFTFAAERIAIASGYSAEAHRIELLHPEPPASADLFAVWYCICGGRIGKDAAARCNGCGK